MDKSALIDNLNEDLAGELAAITQYVTYAAKVTGPFRPQLREFFLGEIDDERGHAEFLSEKIVALGGEPVTTARDVPEASSNREMLEAVRSEERRAVRDYTERVEEAEAFGDKGLAVTLEDMVADETGHAEEVERMLCGWNL